MWEAIENVIVLLAVGYFALRFLSLLYYEFRSRMNARANAFIAADNFANNGRLAEEIDESRTPYCSGCGEWHSGRRCYS